MFSAETGKGDERVGYHCETTHALFAGLSVDNTNNAPAIPAMAPEKAIAAHCTLRVLMPVASARNRLSREARKP